MRGARSAALATALVFGLVLPAAAEVQVEAHLEPETAGLGEVVTFWIEARSDGGLGGLSMRPAFHLDNLRELGPPGRSESFQFINGATSRTLRLTWRLQPIRIGRAAVRDIRVEVAGRRLDLPSQLIRITREPPAGRRPPPQQAWPPNGPANPFDRFLNEDPFGRPRASRPPAAPKVLLRTEVSPHDLYVGQQAIYTLYLYTQADISAIQPDSMPSFRGFWAEEIPLPDRPKTEMVEFNGERYGRIPLLRRALFPIHTGELRIDPAALTMVVDTVARSFFGPSLSRPQRMSRESEPVTVRARPVPDPPARYSGAVGDFRLSANLAPREVHVGEAATLTLTLEGDGHIESLPVPTLAAPPGLRIFPPQETSDHHVGTGGIRGTRTWSYVVVPERRGTFRLASPDVPFFDPRARAFRVAAAAPLELAAKPAAGTAEGTLHTIRSAAVPVDRGLPWRRALPWLFALPMGLGFTVGLVRWRGGHRRRRGGAGSPARAALLDRLRDIDPEAGNRIAANVVEGAYRTYLEKAWDIAAEVPAGRWRDALTERQAPPETTEEVGALADDLHYLRYAPQLSASDTLRQEVLARAFRLARRLG